MERLCKLSKARQNVKNNRRPSRTADILLWNHRRRFPHCWRNKDSPLSAINPTYLKVIRSGNIFSGYYSTDGILWNHVADVTYAVSDPIQTGLDIITVYHDGVFSADFDYFRISGTNPTTPPQIPVGGEWVPIDKSQLLAPWISLVSLMTVITVSFVYVRRKRQQN